jgi:hypothetical protein
MWSVISDDDVVTVDVQAIEAEEWQPLLAEIQRVVDRDHPSEALVMTRKGKPEAARLQPLFDVLAEQIENRAGVPIRFVYVDLPKRPRDLNELAQFIVDEATGEVRPA